MWPEWILGIAGVLAFILVNVLREREQSHPKLSTERYAELNGLLIDAHAIRDQLHSGNKIKAIKLYREQTGVGLKEAKDAVEMMEQERQLVQVSELAQMYKGDDAVEYMLIAGNKINAIKLYRQRTGVGLKEAKDAIDRMALELQIGQRRNQSEQGQVDSDELQRLILAGQKIQAIKYYRQITGVGLKEAKAAVDWLEVHMHQNM